MIGIQTDGTKDKILREDPEKLKAEAKAMAKGMHLDELKPLKNQDPYQQMKDMKEQAGHINDMMSREHEENERIRAEQKKAKRKTPRQVLNLILAHEERKAKEEFDKRRITFIEGEFEKYFDRIQMTPERVLLKEVEREDNAGGIALPEIYEEDMSHYSVVCACDEADGIVAPGDVVMVEKYAGTEVLSGSRKYRIVFVDDIICVVG